ncbi:MAG: hypothetical protein KAU28_07980, partial [Phycisphaerae bacterium]|nr:hypothetical protein [Phycisphaerae bacterium]
EKDLDAAMEQAADEKRPLLVFFMGSPPSDTTHRLAKGTLGRPGNIRAIRKGDFLCIVAKTSLKSDLATKYKITTLPTLLILSPAGKEQNRREGFIGEVDFRNGFLDLKKVNKPEE